MENQYTLPKEFAEKWVAALRSGEYTQSYLEMYGGEKCYCALGLAASICGVKDEVIDNVVSTASVRLANNTSIPFELKTHSGNKPLYLEIMILNDRAKKTFPEIADWIEQNVQFI